jgi:hypothetical protein
VSRFDADRRDSCFRQSTEQPLRQRPSLETDTFVGRDARTGPLETVGGGNSYWRSAQSLPILSQGASTTHPPESQAGGLAPQFACVAA